MNGNAQSAGGGGVPQIVLAVPPEVIRLLTGIFSCLQRLEAEVRDCRLRLGYPAPAVARLGATPGPAAPVAIDIAVPRGRVHTPAGTRASARMKALRGGLGVTMGDLASRLGVSGTMVGWIEAGRNGISIRVDEAMRKLEANNGGRP